MGPRGPRQRAYHGQMVIRINHNLERKCKRISDNHGGIGKGDRCQCIEKKVVVALRQV